MKIKLNVEVYANVPDSFHVDLFSTMKKLDQYLRDSLYVSSYDIPENQIKIEELLVVDCSSTIS